MAESFFMKIENLFHKKTGYTVTVNAAAVDGTLSQVMTKIYIKAIKYSYIINSSHGPFLPFRQIPGNLN